MHLHYGRATLDVVHLRPGQSVLLPSGQAARVKEIKAESIVFRYLDTEHRCDVVELRRELVQRMVRV